MKPLNALEKLLKINFTNQALLVKALSHSSYKRQSKFDNNERLEFFGDAILKMLASQYLYYKYPLKPEGELTKLRSFLISDKTLTLIADWFKLEDYFLATPALFKSNRLKTLLGNAVEALIAVIFIDKGLETTQQFLYPIFEKCESLIGDLLPEDYKTQVQELLQKAKCPLPSYEITKTLGPDHQKLFFVRVRIVQNKTMTFTGFGISKKEAEQKAAQEALKYL